MPTLYELSAQARALADKLADLDLDDQTILDTLEAETGALQEKAVNTAAVVLMLRHTGTGMDEAIKRMQARRKAVEGRADRLEAYLLACLQRASLPGVDTPELSLRRRKNPPRTEIDDASLVPARFWVQKPPPPAEISKTAVKQAIQAGEDVPGAHLEQSERLVIE
jgi:hypothetical protein